jgi:hypothetical protein
MSRTDSGCCLLRIQQSLIKAMSTKLYRFLFHSYILTWNRAEASCPCRPISRFMQNLRIHSRRILLNVVVQRAGISRIQPSPTPASIGASLPEAILDIVVEMSLVVVMPARKSRTVLDDVAKRPGNSELVEVLRVQYVQHRAVIRIGRLPTYRRDIVVRADDVKVTSREPVQHVGYGLFGSPSTVRLGLGSTSFTGVHPTGADNVSVCRSEELPVIL